MTDIDIGPAAAAILEHARETALVVDDAGTIRYVSPAVERFFGHDPDALVGDSFAAHVHPDDERRLWAQLEAVVGGDVDRWTVACRVRRADDTWAWIEATGQDALNDDRLGGVVLYLREVATPPDRGLETDSPVTDRALDAIDDVFCIFGPDDGLVRWNDRLNEVTGYADRELAAMTAPEFVVEDDRAAVTTHAESVSEHAHDTLEVTLLTADGERIPYEFYSDTITDSTGAVVGRVSVGRDVTARKRVEAELAERNERLADFADLLAHDLRNPLTIAQGRLELLAEAEVDEERATHYEATARSLDRIEELVTDALALAKSGQDIPAGEREGVALSAVAEAAWRGISTGDATLHVDGSRTVDADVSRLQQILENLFRNAVEHVGGDVTVWFGVHDDGFYVEDDGPGVPEDVRDDVFDPGFTTKDEGTGFGMASVAQLVAAHGWTIDVTDGSEGGARFEVHTGDDR